MGGWLARSDLALESQAHFFAVAEHRLVPARARNVTTQLRKAGRYSVWAPSLSRCHPKGSCRGGVISLHNPRPSLLTFFTPSFQELTSLGRAMRVFPPLGKGVSPTSSYLWVPGAESDPGKLALAEHLLAAVLAEAKMCCSGQPVMLASDLNADPLSFPPQLEACQMGPGLSWTRLLPREEDWLPHSHANSSWTRVQGVGPLACSIAMAATTACGVLPDRWFSPHFAVRPGFSISAWDATVEMSRVYSLI